MATLELRELLDFSATGFSSAAHVEPIAALMRESSSNTGIGETSRFAEEEQFLLIKPEAFACEESRDCCGVLHLIFAALLEVGEIDLAVRFDAHSMAARRLIQGQYHVLESNARHVSAEVRAAVLAFFSDAVAENMSLKVLTAEEALIEHGYQDARALADAWDQRSSIKIGPGLYACLFGGDHVVLNGFYPAQRAWLTQQGGQVLGLRLRSSTTLRELRQHVVGTIDPEFAELCSIRGRLHRAQNKLGITNICKAKNFLHISPNPLDALLGIEHLLRCAGRTTARGLFREFVFAKALRGMPCVEAYLDTQGGINLTQMLLHNACEDFSYCECSQAILQAERTLAQSSGGIEKGDFMALPIPGLLAGRVPL